MHVSINFALALLLSVHARKLLEIHEVVIGKYGSSRIMLRITTGVEVLFECLMIRMEQAYRWTENQRIS